jgi:putative hydrolase of the HAD superfamily
VLRHHDATVTEAIEARAGLLPGEILAVALAPTRCQPALLGQLSADGWRELVAAALADRLRRVRPGEARSEDEALTLATKVVEEWNTYRGQIVPEVLDMVTAVRATGAPVALCTNATDELRDDLARFDLVDAFDAVVGSAEIAVAKPHPDFFAAACEAVSMPAASCLFVDDTARNVAGARAAGLLAFRYTGLADLPYLRAAFTAPAP